MTAEDIFDRPSGPLLAEDCIPVLETQRLVLRTPRLEDAATVAGLADDRRIAAMAARVPHPYRVKDAEDWISQAWRTGDCPFLISHRGSGAVMGSVGFVQQNTTEPTIGYWLGAAHLGQGFATEAVRAVIDYLFTTRDIAAVAASVRVVNERSRKVLERCAFQWTGAGLVRSAFLQSSVPVDRFRLDRATWASFKAWRDPALRNSLRPLVNRSTDA